MTMISVWWLKIEEGLNNKSINTHLFFKLIKKVFFNNFFFYQKDSHTQIFNHQAISLYVLWLIKIIINHTYSITHVEVLSLKL